MLSMNKTLLSALFISPNPQPEDKEVGRIYNMLHSRMFPCERLYIDYLQAQSIDKQYELAATIIQSLCFYANFPPPFYALNDVLCIENYQKNVTKKSDGFIPRDHFLHIVNLYIFGIYVFFYNSELYSQIAFDNILKEKTITVTIQKQIVLKIL